MIECVACGNDITVRKGEVYRFEATLCNGQWCPGTSLGYNQKFIGTVWWCPDCVVRETIQRLIAPRDTPGD